ncbi:hypothetical protein AA0113_g7914 [Alternaria arborescens]|uniref:Uncharacterized protein n=1 Tax=Alternaria arborescens TaxID=156630 RepID=A0A4Q4RN92_9PLEO|nr:hypothetical protein AA0111_g7778 [Alternaria arborescens]RYN24085.1 hypothetical protein AA0112_g9045 [Alternaria arborescens]RYO26818.1 hypothetical protein AA0111_g7778 [Alternaria arborescens]RYO58379.1 hypothetical protein AA0113_g7914 [Alternaria arborescens]
MLQQSQPPPEPAPVRARRTTRRVTLPNEKNTGRVQERYAAYRDFPWEKIEEFLRRKWPHWKDFKPEKVNDNWQFEVPEKLTEGDRRQLTNLRNAPKRTRRPSNPDPPTST